MTKQANDLNTDTVKNAHAQALAKVRWDAHAAAAAARTGGTSKVRADMFDGKFDPDVLADMIHSGHMPADGSGLSKGQWGMVQTSWGKKYPGEDLTSKISDWKRFVKNVSTMEGSKFQQVNYGLDTADRALELTRQYSHDLADIAPGLAYTPLNELQQKLQQDFNWGDDATKEAVTHLISQAAVTQTLLASVYGGGAPTDQDLKQARLTLNFEKPAAVFDSQIDVGQQDVALRRSAVRGLTMLGGANQYARTGDAAPKGGTSAPKGDLGMVKKSPLDAFVRGH